MELLSLPAPPRPLAPGLVLGVLLNAAVLSEEPVGRVSEAVQTVREVMRANEPNVTLCVKGDMLYHQVCVCV